MKLTNINVTETIYNYLYMQSYNPPVETTTNL